MTRTLQRRLAELERRMAGPRRRRYVWWSKGEPKPQPQAGDEELVVIRWQWDEDETEALEGGGCKRDCAGSPGSGATAGGDR